MMTKNICIISDYSPWEGWGVEQVAKEIILLLEQSDYNIKVIYRTNKPKKSDVNNNIEVYEVRNIPIPIISDLYYYFVAGFIAVYLKSDIVHAHAKTGFGFSLFKLFFNKSSLFISTFHGTPKFIDSYEFKFPKTIFKAVIKVLFSFMVKIICFQSDCITSVSNNVRNELIHDFQVNSNKIKVIHNGVDIDTYKPRDKDKSKNELGLNRNFKYILFIGKDTERKNLQIVLDVLNEIRIKHKYVKLLLVGPNPDFLPGNGHKEYITTLGYIDETLFPKIYTASDLLLHPSKYEGHPLTVLEALSSGCPVIASPSSNIEAIKNGNGYFFARSKSEFSELCLKLLNNEKLRLQMALLGREEIVKKFEKRKKYSEYVNLFDNILTKNEEI